MRAFTSHYISRPEDYTRTRRCVRVLSSVIISFKCGALSPISISIRKPGPFLFLLVFSLSFLAPRHPTSFIIPTLLTSSVIKLEKVLHTSPVLPSILRKFRFSFLLFLYKVLAGTLPAILPSFPSFTSTRLLRLSRLRFPQDNR